MIDNKEGAGDKFDDSDGLGRVGTWVPHPQAQQDRDTVLPL